MKTASSKFEFVKPGWVALPAGLFWLAILLLLLLGGLAPCWSQGPYTLTVTATNGKVYKDPDAANYAADTVVRLVAQPAQGYRFVNWTGDEGTIREMMIDVTMTANKAVTANFSAWIPPIGVPEPTFGIWDTYRGYDADGTTAVNGQHIHYTRSPSLTYQASAGGGFFTHYVDNTDPAATDTANTYGSIAKPRLTIPLGTIPAGSIVEIHGGPYATTDRRWNGNGTVTTAGDAPIFIRGASLAAMPEVQSTLTLGYFTSKDARWFILENLRIHPATTGGISVTSYEETRNVVVRQCDIEGHTTTIAHQQATGFGNSTGALATATLHDCLLYGNYIHTWGDWTAVSGDPDNQGCSVYTGIVNGGSGVPQAGQDKYTYNIWLIDNAFQHCTGDGIQANANVAQPYQYHMHHVYMGRNHAWENKQPGVWVKAGEDIIFSQNNCWKAGQSLTSSGGCMGAQYGACRVWFLYNYAHEDKHGIRYATDDQWGIFPDYNAKDNYLIGNVVYNIHRLEGETGGYNGWKYGAAFMLQNETSTRSLFLNTVYDCDEGIVCARRAVVKADNNLFYDIGGQLYTATLTDGLATTEIDNNIVGPTVGIYWGTSTLYNLTTIEGYAPGHFDGTVIDDPEYVDPANADFHLQSTSPAVDSAVMATRTQAALDLFQTTYGISINVDADGNLRGATWDQGAYEYDPSLPPGAPTTPSPANEATGQANSLTLSWSPGAYAAYYIVKRGTVNPPVGVLDPHCLTTSTASGELAPNTTYYWQVTSVNGSGTADSSVWSFTTETPQSVPGAISSPSPANSATGVGTSLTLSWTAATDAATYDVYLGTVNPPVTIVSPDQPGLSYAASGLAYDQDYYWKVVGKNNAGSGSASVLTFHTATEPPVEKYLILGGSP